MLWAIKRHRTKFIFHAVLVIAAVFVAVFICNSWLSVTAENEPDIKAAAGDESTALIDAALYTRHEFFGAQAIVPYPTAEARNRLAAVLENHRDNPQLLLKLAQLDEKLGREDDALRGLQSYVEHANNKQEALETLAAFFDRRAQFTAEAETLERLLATAPEEQRVDVFRRLIELAEKHLLDKYLTPSFYAKIVEQNPSAFAIVKQYQDKLIEQGDSEAALKLLRENKDRFPEYRTEMIEAEVSLLDDMGRAKEAESVYTQSFDPFWPTELSNNFYDFLKDHNRFRAYGHELRTAFRRNPVDFDAAVRLVHYSKYAGASSPDVFVQLEKARAARQIAWKPDELITISRLLLSSGYGEAASRFLYTLYLKGELKPGSPLRAKVLYQLFALVSDAGEQRTSLTRGDLKFYQDIATADPHPGIFGGILSLLLSDTDPQNEFDLQEERAVKRFNRAAAYRIFLAYKQENPTAPELAQMYLDIVRLYSANKDLKVAAETLAEFEKRYGDAPAYAEVALKLADCYIAVSRFDDERAAYQRILDYLGKHKVKGETLAPGSSQASESTDSENKPALDARSEPTTVKPVTAYYPPISNPGSDDSAPDYYSGYSFPDYLEDVQLDSDESDTQVSTVDYQTVLSRYVASLAKDNRTADILALYSAELKKYPDEEGLYEQMLQWLGQTNLVDEQLRVYQEALRSFPSTTWQDRLARWFIRQRRTAEFETFSRELLAKVNDAEAERYLQEFIQGNKNADPASFDAKLYVALYSLAHQRFPHNLHFVSGLLNYYSAHKQWDQWRMLVAEYYFESREVRVEFLSHLASRNELRNYLTRARDTLNTATPESQSSLPYKLFRADAAAWLSNYEEAVDAYRELNRLYPNSPEFAERLVSFTRSFGQHNRRFLEESGTISHALADAAPSVAAYRTRAGEIQAELGDYNNARAEWEQLVPIASGDEDSYLETATIYWDYFQYDDALRTIENLRRRMNDPTLYAFQAAVILEDKHQPREALAEYVKALANEDEDVPRARRRLVTLSKRPGVYEQIVAEFNKQSRGEHGWEFVWEYTDFLNDSGRWPAASAVLRAEVTRSDSSAFLTRARDLFASHEETAAQVAALQRLIATANSPRSAISYRLQLADVYSEKGQRAQAANVLQALVNNYPNNYGVLSESADVFWRVGLRSNAVAVLQSGMRRGLGRFHYLFGRKLAARHVEMQQFASAQQVLETLNREDRMNVEVFHELARIYVRTGNQEGLRTTFRATVEAVKKQDADPRETRAQIAQLRQEMIGAFTRLKDYASAIEQHIEIINRDADEEQYVEAAINYVRRYGGGDTLLKYYQRTSQEAYKDYRWNVVLARIYDAQGDVANSVRQYRAAIDNQPEMIELYDSLADVYTRAKDYDSALTALRKAQEFSNDDPQHVQRTIAVLVKAGREREAEAERRKLPQEIVKPLSVSDQFAEAAQLRGSDLKQATETYRNAYNTFAANPFNNELRAADIVGYVQTVRSEERLDEITKRLWTLRNRIAAEAKTAKSTNAGKAQSMLATFDGAVVDAVGGVATEKATGDELAGLFQFLHEQVGATLRDGDNGDTLPFLRNLSRRAGFGSLDEETLKTLKDRAYSARDWPSYHTHLRALIDLYDRCGAYRQILDLLQAERSRNAQPDGFDYASLIATNARLVGDSSLELQALREHFERPTDQKQLTTSADPLVERYFEALWENGESGRDELRSRAQQPTSRQLQLITFLLAKGDKELVHTAIENSPLSPAWKSSRSAEVSLQLGEFERASENYFTTALKFQSIGELIKQQPDTKLQLVGDEWYQLAQTYGRWLYSSGNAEQKLKSRLLLPARMENRPQDIGEQARLGRWYLEAEDPVPAIEHLALAHESAPGNKQIIADLGSAFFLRGYRERANQLWDKLIADKNAGVDDYRFYFETLTKHGLTEQARKRSTPFVVERLKEDFADDDDNGYAYQYSREDVDAFKRLIRVLARSFGDPGGAGKARVFAQLCAAAPDNRFLPALLLRESLVARDEMGPFYELLIERSQGFRTYDSDYSYTALREANFDDGDAESAFDHESDYKVSEPESAKFKWEKEYLDYLIDRRQNAEARRLIASMERDLQRRFARPVWLRLASVRLDVRDGRIAQAIDRLHWLVGIKYAVGVEQPMPPSIERLNDAVALLADEGHGTEGRKLLETAYARGIALGHFEPAYFAGLARIAFERGDKNEAITWLQTMVNLTAPERKEETVASLMAMPRIAAHAGGAPESEDVQFDRTVALRLASETAGEFAAYDSAINFRQQLLAASPADEENRIELIRLLAVNGNKDEAIQNLAATIADRNATRTLRWQAVWLTPEIAGKDLAVWTNVRERVRPLSASDVEMNTALEALSLNAAGRVDEATKLIAAAETASPNEYLSSLHAILSKGNASDALNSFARALIASQEPAVAKSFGFAEDPSLEQIVNLYLKQNQPRAALRVAERIAAFQANNKSAEQNEDEAQLPAVPETIDGYQTLRARAESRRRTTHANLLALLSTAAEQLGDLNRAVELERLRLALVNTLAEKKATEARLDHLQQLQTAAGRVRRISLVVDQKLVATE
ncbi:MAG TPA: tetratricopeptide repeat protein [Pyrinomonadaceae bacterium]|nr:tetratricopeptide repeat protein [Pyrinomonadaceae bacterium]